MALPLLALLRSDAAACYLVGVRPVSQRARGGLAHIMSRHDVIPPPDEPNRDDGDGEGGHHPSFIVEREDKENHSQVVIIPDKLPSFGLTEREMLRLSQMACRDEPLVHEVIGICMLLGAIGQRFFGFLGFLFCALQLGPFVSLTPGRVGNAVRHVGFFVYSIVVRALAIVASTSSAVWRALMMSSDDGETTESRAAPVRH